MNNVKDLCIDKFSNCPTHPQFLLELICINRTCIQPLCRRCVPDHRKVHQQMNTVDNIKQLSEVKLEHLKKESILRNKPKPINPNRVNEIIKKMVQDYFKRKNEEMDGQIYSQISEVKSLLDVMVEEGRIEVPGDLKGKLFQFLRNNLIMNTENV